MLVFDSEIVGKHAEFGFVQDKIKRYGFTIGGNWEYDHGSFDTILWSDGGETIYLRVPFVAINGMLDSYNTHIQFKNPYVIKHIAHVGLDYDDSSLLDATGISQFQTPIEKDGNIDNQNKWISVGEKFVEKVLPYVH